MTKYERHIRQLCKEHKIKVSYVDRKYCCNVYLNQVWIPKRIRSLRTYAISLHEVCHILNERPHTQTNFWRDAWEIRRNKKKDFTTKHTLMKEIEAWSKAFDISKWRGQAMINVFIFAISTYVQCYNDCHKHPMNIDHLCRRFQKKI